jgi:hypothetical protein
MKTLVVFSLLLANAPQVLGCSDFMWQLSANDWIRKPRAIYHGQVVSIRAPADYVVDGNTDSLAAIVVTRDLSTTIEVKVFETLRGPKLRVVEATLDPCISVPPGYLDEIVLFLVGETWHAKRVLGENPENKIAGKVVESLSKHQKP